MVPINECLGDVVYCTPLYYDVEWRQEFVDLKLALLIPEPPVLPLAPLELPGEAPPPPIAPTPTLPPPPPPPAVAPTPSSPLAPTSTPPPLPPVDPTQPPPSSSTTLYQPQVLPAAPPLPSPTFRSADDQAERTKRSRNEIDGVPLPINWTIKKKTRKNGSRTDMYYYSPQGFYLRSRKAMEAFLSGQDVKVCKERKGKGKEK